MGKGMSEPVSKQEGKQAILAVQASVQLGHVQDSQHEHTMHGPRLVMRKGGGGGRGAQKGCTWPEGLQGLELLVQGAPCHDVCIIIPGASPVMLHYRPVSTLEHIPVLCTPYSQHIGSSDKRVSIYPAGLQYL